MTSQTWLELETIQISCLLLLPVSLMKIEFILTEKKWRHRFLHYKYEKNFHAHGQITLKKMIRSDPKSNSFFTPVLVTCKFGEDWVHSNLEKMETPFSHSKSMGTLKGEYLRREKSDSSQMRTRPKFNVCPHYLQVLQRFD